MSGKNKSKGKAAVYFLIAVVFIAAGIISVNLPRYLNKYKRNIKEKCVLYVYQNTDYQVLLDSLAPKLRDMKSFAKVAQKEGLPQGIHPGRYVFDRSSTNIKIVRSIKYGYQDALTVTFAGNIRSLGKIASMLGAKLEADSADFMKEFSDSSVWASNGMNGFNFISIFIPDSYQVYWTVTPDEFVKRMKKEYDSFWEGDRSEKAEEIGFTPQEVSTLASIVCQESNYVPEYPKIAGVYINRLHKGWNLCADPTVKFALDDPSIKRILFRHLKVNSPYNTYKNPGLPPGPIVMPSKEAIDGVLDYEHSDNMYFCANSKLDGTHLFAVTGAQHNANARKYQKVLDSLWRAKRAAQAH